MDCDWYSFTTIHLSGTPFFAGYIPHDIMVKNKLIMLPIPVHDDLNTSLFEKNRLFFFFDKEDQLLATMPSTEEWRDVDEDEIITSFYNGKTDWFSDNGAHYLYICVSDVFNKSELAIPGPYEITRFSASVMCKDTGETTADDIEQITEIYNPTKETENFLMKKCDIVISTSFATCAISGFDEIKFNNE